MNKLYTTPAGKEIQCIIDPKTAHVKIQFTTGGELPASLQGLFTSIREAEKEIYRYIATKVTDDTEDVKVKRTIKKSIE